MQAHSPAQSLILAVCPDLSALRGVLHAMASFLLRGLHTGSRLKAQRVLRDYRHLNAAETSPERTEA